MKTYLQMDGDRLVEYVEKREYDLLAQERADFGVLVDKLERELDAIVKALEKVWPFLKEDDGDGANAPHYQAAINAVKAVITSKKGEQS